MLTMVCSVDPAIQDCATLSSWVGYVGLIIGLVVFTIEYPRSKKKRGTSLPRASLYDRTVVLVQVRACVRACVVEWRTGIQERTLPGGLYAVQLVASVHSNPFHSNIPTSVLIDDHPTHPHPCTPPFHALQKGGLYLGHAST